MVFEFNLNTSAGVQRYVFSAGAHSNNGPARVICTGNITLLEISTSEPILGNRTTTASCTTPGWRWRAVATPRELRLDDEGQAPTDVLPPISPPPPPPRPPPLAPSPSPTPSADGPRLLRLTVEIVNNADRDARVHLWADSYPGSGEHDCNEVRAGRSWVSTVAAGRIKTNQVCSFESRNEKLVFSPSWIDARDDAFIPHMWGDSETIWDLGPSSSVGIRLTICPNYGERVVLLGAPYGRVLSQKADPAPDC